MNFFPSHFIISDHFSLSLTTINTGDHIWPGCVWYGGHGRTRQTRTQLSHVWCNHMWNRIELNSTRVGHACPPSTPGTRWNKGFVPKIPSHFRVFFTFNVKKQKSFIFNVVLFLFSDLWFSGVRVPISFLICCHKGPWTLNPDPFFFV